jgi:hypothetical protein
MISITIEHHVFLSEAYQPIPAEEAEQTIDSPEWEKWREAKVLENTALAHKKVMVLVDRITVMKSKYVFKIKKNFGEISK